MRRRVLFVVNDAGFFLSHRSMLADAVRRAGHDVHVACPDDPAATQLRGLGYTHHPIRLSRGGRNAFQELRTALDLVGLYRNAAPDLVHLITIKPVLYGGIAARLSRVPCAVFAISGMGYVFLAEGRRAALQRRIIWAAYRLALGHRNSRLIVQNPDDRATFLAARATTEDRVLIVRGNGIDLDEYPARPQPDGEPLVVLPARMLWDKGVGEFVEAARLLRARGVTARLALVGSAGSENPAVVPEARLRAWEAEGVVEWWGHRTDMPEVLARSSIVCLPSYREGIPRALIEAAATARAIVATDVPGCREVVRHRENGLLVPARNPAALAAALEELVARPEVREAMGRRGRQLAEAELSAAVTIGQVLSAYEALFGRAAARG
jgi:glycosyltransferase involved in cell wall biosynthesis